MGLVSLLCPLVDVCTGMGPGFDECANALLLTVETSFVSTYATNVESSASIPPPVGGCWSNGIKMYGSSLPCPLSPIRLPLSVHQEEVWAMAWWKSILDQIVVSCHTSHAKATIITATVRACLSSISPEVPTPRSGYAYDDMMAAQLHSAFVPSTIFLSLSPQWI